MPIYYDDFKVEYALLEHLILDLDYSRVPELGNV